MVIKRTYQNEEVPLSAQIQFKNMLHQVRYCYPLQDFKSCRLLKLLWGLGLFAEKILLS